MALHVVRLTVLLTVFACSVSLQAQVGSSIQGKVTNTSGAVIPGVQVSIKDLTSNDVRLVVTNTSGGQCVLSAAWSLSTESFEAWFRHGYDKHDPRYWSAAGRRP